MSGQSLRWLTLAARHQLCAGVPDFQRTRQLIDAFSRLLAHVGVNSRHNLLGTGRTAMCATHLRPTRPPKPRNQYCPRRLAVEALEGRELPATFTVTTFADVVSATDGKLSLREAISLASANAGL